MLLVEWEVLTFSENITAPWCFLRVGSCFSLKFSLYCKSLWFVVFFFFEFSCRISVFIWVCYFIARFVFLPFFILSIHACSIVFWRYICGSIMLKILYYLMQKPCSVGTVITGLSTHCIQRLIKINEQL